MGSLATMIGLDLKLCATRAVGGLMGADAAAGAGRLEMLEESVRSLEEEKRKIEVFRRELPLCMSILTDVIEGLKKEMEECRVQRFAGRCEEFMPPKRELDEEDEAKAEADCKEKMKWMSSAQLWSNNSGEKKEDEKNEEKINRGFDGRRPEKERSFLESKSRRGSGAFVPFKGLKAHGANALPTTNPLPAISLPSPAVKNSLRPLSPTVDGHQVFPTVVSGAPAPAGAPNGHLSHQTQQPPSRKARRCWSPELHRRFVLALQQLGGAQVATPKQIRELMKVDELTNDEVKSHLQKYRLHTRRAPGASAATKLPVAAVGGGSPWPAASENYSSSSEQSLSKSGSPQSPLQLAGSNPTLSITARDSSEEDGKSESSSWKRE